MRILSIETSCDETAIAILDISGGTKSPKIKVLSHNVASQVKLHEQYGGVFPMMAKREHQKNLIPLFIEVLKESNFFEIKDKKEKIKEENRIRKILTKEQEMLEQFLKEIPKIKVPKIDVIAVTTGPGLEPALWVGINFAHALAYLWNIPLVPVNHMEGHILSVLINEQKGNSKIQFPAISLLVSGGHTELILVKDWMKYKKIGQTRDDAAGEAFDKVARMLGLPYPGGPEISKLAAQARNQLKINNEELKIKLPRPMINSKDFDFSFSGLKTAVLYLLRDLEKNYTGILQNSGIVSEIAHEFENAVVEVLVHKTVKAIEKYKAKSLIVGGGVASNNFLRGTLTNKVNNLRSTIHDLEVFFPTKELSTDNAIMIGIAGYFQFLKKNKKGARLSTLSARGNLSL